MISKTLFVIGVNIIVIAHVQSFVLLTANFEDVKKLAQKFVSDSLADKIAEFVAKASGNGIAMKTTKEDYEKREYLESDSVSEENKSETKESISKENLKYKLKANKKTSKHKSFKSMKPKSSEKISKNDYLKESISKSEVNEKLKYKFISENNNNKLDDYSEESKANRVSIESTIGWIEEGIAKNLTSNQDESDSDYVFRFNKNYNDEARETTLTTRKEKIEFDQYDNTYYPKAVATSGSLALRLLDSRKSRYRKD